MGTTTINYAFENAIEKIKRKRPSQRAKLYVWRQRFREGKLSFDKITSILKDGGFSISIEVKKKRRTTRTK